MVGGGQAFAWVPCFRAGSRDQGTVHIWAGKFFVWGCPGLCGKLSSTHPTPVWQPTCPDRAEGQRGQNRPELGTLGLTLCPWWVENGKPETLYPRTMRSEATILILLPPTAASRQGHGPGERRALGLQACTTDRGPGFPTSYVENKTYHNLGNLFNTECRFQENL